jgi:hypothetical protein
LPSFCSALLFPPPLRGFSSLPIPLFLSGWVLNKDAPRAKAVAPAAHPAAPFNFADERVTLEAPTGGEHWLAGLPTNGWLGPCYCHQRMGTNRGMYMYCVNKTACDSSLVDAVYRVGEGTVEGGSEKKIEGRINSNSPDKLSKVSLHVHVPTSILFEVKKMVEAVGKSAILSNGGWCQVRPLLFKQSVVFPIPPPPPSPTRNTACVLAMR